MSSPLTEAEIAAARSELPGWTVENDALIKTFTFGSFREAFSFMTRIAFEAEARDHHPDWSNSYNKVIVRLSTHAAGGKITALDCELASRIEEIAWTE